PLAASGGLWGQAMEIVADGRVRVAGRGVANRDSIAGAAIAEAVIAGLFGVEPGFTALRSTNPHPDTVTAPDLGTLENLNLRPAPEPVGAC
ncbi:hypothetical protein, partial [Asanoa sp. NPDC050611]|uniref:hypothetical protein n=1 Tax=Asanoa sp. NPDC050611 TaxID=3157098 RepID=UPI0033D8190F